MKSSSRRISYAQLNLWIQVVVGFIAIFSLFVVTSNLIDHNLDGISNRIFGMVIRLLFAIVCWFYTTRILHLKINCPPANIKKGFLVTIPIWFISICFLCESIHLMYTYKPNYNIFTNCVIWLLYSLSVGIFEEYLCRGLLFNGILKILDGLKNQLLFSVLLSSFIFAILHVVNYLDGSQTLTFTLLQIVAAIAGGSIFAVTYYKSKSIWICILAHAVLDFTYYFSLPA